MEYKSSHLDSLIIGNTSDPLKTISTLKDKYLFSLLSQIEPTSFDEALSEDKWILAMQEQLKEFKMNDIWDLVPIPEEKNPIGTKWVFRNKLNEEGKVIINKAQLIAQGDTHLEDIDYIETFALVARLVGFCNADNAEDKLERKNISGNYTFLGETLISWSRKK
ncbi:uncharacterized mitochondrial protein AtMg00820-like [Cicer arietinum]|uniref:Uncharacterized protein LOC113785806 n=1 Tax=Cicer arietinum TaxID=3827 RepID=A0A3Q7Y9C3_CICAR|nr:uncharacterized protein LOC113785806 [Cicer arietinum]